MRRYGMVLVAFLLLALPAPALAAIGDENADPGDETGSWYGYVEDAVLLSFAEGFPAAAARRAFAAANGLEEVSFTPLSHFFRFRITDGQPPDRVVEALRSNPAIALVTKIARGRWDYVPPDPLYVNQWYLPKVRMPQAWDLAAGGSTSYIALVDSGVQTSPSNHPDLGVIAGKNFVTGTSNVNDVYGHGTRVAGIMAAFTGATNGSIGIAGINYAAPILVAKIGDSAPDIDAAAAGIEYAVQRGASAINASFGFRGLSSSEREVLRQAVVAAWNAGQPVVAAAGNDGTSFVGLYPAAFTKVITVGASTKSDVRWVYSNYGDASVPLYPNLVAPGVEMCTTKTASGYDCAPGPDGTSFAAPMVTGTIGLMRKLYPGIGSLAIVDRLEDSADHVGGYSYTGSLCDGRGISVYMGCGRLDAYGAIN
ncbi:MAG: hypothetical protein FIA92_14730 [Chloroflexi bacterium]|nr:hypothetical protein [Chloroflexota bacterium]